MIKFLLLAAIAFLLTPWLAALAVVGAALSGESPSADFVSPAAVSWVGHHIKKAI